MIICNLESNKVHNKDDLPAQLPALNRVTWRRAVVAVSLCLDDIVNKTWPQILIRWHQKLISWHQFKPGTKN